MMYEGGTIPHLRESSFDLLSERVNTRAESFKTEMTRWSNVSNTVDAINLKVKNFADQNSLDLYDIQDWSIGKKNELMLGISENVIDAMAYNNVTGSYILFSEKNYTENPKKYGLYVRCDNPTNVAPANVSIQIASKTVLTELQYKGYTGASSKEVYYNFNFSGMFDGSSIDYFTMPFNEIIKTGDETNDFTLSWYGYWGLPVKIAKESRTVITYSVPLVAGNKLYGVYGIELSIDSIISKLPNYELPGAKNKGSYVLGVKDKDGKYDIAASRGGEVEYLLGSVDTVELTYNEKDEIYTVNDISKNKNEAYASVSTMKLYNTNTPFEEKQWSIMGIVRGKDLLYIVYSTEKFLLISLIIITAMGLLATALITLMITRPILKMTKSLNVGGKVTSELQTNIYEIDQLIDSLRVMQDKVSDSESKMSRLIRIADLPIGAFQVDTKTDSLFITDEFYEIMNCSELSGKLLTKDQFDKFFKDIEKYKNDSLSSEEFIVYDFISQDGKPKYAQLKHVYADDKAIGIVEDVTDEIIEKRRITAERDYDMMTSLYNRRSFGAKVSKLFIENHSFQCGAFIMIDLDNLKAINDLYGHDSGDEYIKAAGKVLKSFASNRFYSCRLSGDEFSVFMFDFETYDEIRELVLKIEEAFNKETFFTPDNKLLKVRCSAGVAYYPQDSVNFDELRKFADFAMYEVKHSTKGMFNEFNLSSFNEHSYLLTNNEELNNLIEKNLVEYHFQPIVSAKDGEVYGYEALMRSQLAALPTAKAVISIAKAQSKLYLIEKLTWFNALRYAEKYHEKILGKKLFINSIPNQVLINSDIELLESKYGDFLNNIVMEFTEEEKLSPDITKIKQQLTKKWNSELALDDFGTGYSTETVLLLLSPHYIKIDMFMVRNINIDSEKRNLVIALVNYAKSLKIKVIAEGVETVEELETVIKCGVDYIQGYFIAKAAPQPEAIPDSVTSIIKKLNAPKKRRKIN